AGRLVLGARAGGADAGRGGRAGGAAGACRQQCRVVRVRLLGGERKRVKDRRRPRRQKQRTDGLAASASSVWGRGMRHRYLGGARAPCLPDRKWGWLTQG